MNSLFSENAIDKMKRIRKVFLWAAVCILIGELIVGAILILSQSFDESIGRLMATFALCAVAMFISVNNFSRIEKGGSLIQGFAFTSLIMNVIWLVLSILLTWGILPNSERVFNGSYGSTQMSIMAKMNLVAVAVSVACFFISNIWAIEETIKPVKPLKITAVVCELYCVLYVILVIMVGDSLTFDFRWGALALLAGLAFVIMAIAAAIVSNTGAKKNNGAVTMDEKKMQSTIQEMVEKEVQARLKAEREKVQSVEVPPAVEHGNEAQPEVPQDLNGLNQGG